MIQAFMSTLAKDMKTLTDNSTSHEVALKELLYRMIITLDDQYEVWAAYVKDKGA
jgi:hypothetical protein